MTDQPWPYAHRLRTIRGNLPESFIAKALGPLLSRQPDKITIQGWEAGRTPRPQGRARIIEEWIRQQEDRS